MFWRIAAILCADMFYLGPISNIEQNEQISELKKERILFW